MLGVAGEGGVTLRGLNRFLLGDATSRGASPLSISSLIGPFVRLKSGVGATRLRACRHAAVPSFIACGLFG